MPGRSPSASGRKPATLTLPWHRSARRQSREKLLAYFAARQGCALARNDILDAVWGHSVFVTPRSIDRCVATLRGKIEPDPHAPTFVRTIRDIGYRFEPGTD